MAAFLPIMQGIGAGAAAMGSLGALTSSLFGPSVKKQIKWQKQAQQELNQQAAQLNYEYGEKAAENAYNRQMAMYQRSYEDQSYSAMKKQMQDANLSVGLMYGNGASGGGAGSMTGAPQGETGGAVPGDASMAIGLALQEKQLRIQQAQAAADIAVKTAEAANIRANTQKTKQEIDTNEFQKLYNQYKEKNFVKDYAEGDFDAWYNDRLNRKLEYYFNWYLKTGNERAGDYELGNMNFDLGVQGKQLKQTVNDLVSQIAYRDKSKEIIEFEKTLKNAQAYNAFMNIAVALGRNEIEEARVQIEKYVAEFGTGEQFNWKTILEVATRFIPGIGPILSTSRGTKR